MTKESMEFDVVIVGGGPSELTAAIRLAQISKNRVKGCYIALVEKNFENGLHIQILQLKCAMVVDKFM